MEAIDDQLVRLLNSRAVCAFEIRRLIRSLAAAERAPECRDADLERAARASPGPLPPETVQRIFRSIVQEGLRLETRSPEVIK
jgi:chorismate mutase